MNSVLTDGLDEALDLPQDRISVMGQAGGRILMLATVGLACMAVGLRNRRPAWLALAALSQLLTLAVAWVFRNPERTLPAGDHVVLAPADGVIEAADGAVDLPRFLAADATGLAIRLSPRDVQVVRAPIAGTVGLRRYQVGDAGQSERNWLGIEQADGTRVLMAQEAGSIWRQVPNLFGRHIICWPEPGDDVEAGQEVGHLPLGHGVSLFLPPEAQVVVRPGQRARAGETVIALLPHPTR